MHYLTRLIRCALLVIPLAQLCSCAGSDTSPSSITASSNNVSSSTATSSSSSPAATINADNSMAMKMANTIMTRSPNGYGSWNYETGTVLRGFEEIYKATNDPRLFDYIKKTVDLAVGATGKISGFTESDYNIDEVKEGNSVLFLYKATGEERYKTAADALRNQLTNQPRNRSGGFWHKNKYPNQMWLDGLYMGEPFYAQFSVMFDEPQNFDDIYKQFTLMESSAQDPITGLLFHAWDETGAAFWADPISNQSPVFWGRAIGWYVMALVDVLEYLPQSQKAQRSELIKILQRQVNALEAFQDDDGVWWQVVDRINDRGNWQESSATAMYIYAIAKGIRMGYLSDEHTPTVTRGWQGLNDVFIVENTNNQLTLAKTCEGTGVGDTYDFYISRRALDNDNKGLGPYLMAAAEMLYLIE